MPEVDGITLNSLRSLAKSRRAVFVRLLQKLKRERSHIMDEVVCDLDRQTFERIDCMDCANCCKTTPALILQTDMDRIASYLNISVGEFLKTYVEMDEDGDFVTKGQPCPFLRDDNACRIYEVRPAACADYPHTASAGIMRNSQALLENTAICPAAFRIVERMEADYQVLFQKSEP